MTSLNRNLVTPALPNGGAQIFSYNSQGQLNQINAQNADGSGGALLSYSVYRGDGKRAWKQNAAGARTYFFYDGDTLIGTSGDAANSASVWLWGADGLIGTQTKNAAGAVTSGYYLYDAAGNLAQTVSGAGVVTPVAAYTAWGEVVPNTDGTKPSLGSLGYGAKFGYWRDSDSGLYLCTLRFYDPANGRFVTRDPIGFAGGSNLFGYTGNDPSNGTDPSGLSPVYIPIYSVSSVMSSPSTPNGVPTVQRPIITPVYTSTSGYVAGTSTWIQGGTESERRNVALMVKKFTPHIMLA